MFLIQIYQIDQIIVAKLWNIVKHTSELNQNYISYFLPLSDTASISTDEYMIYFTPCSMCIRTSNMYECHTQVELSKVPRVPDSCLGFRKS